MDFSRFRPWIVVVEATRPGTREENFETWEPILLAARYRFAWFDGLNRFYLAEEHHDALAPSFRAPPNVFDGFRRYDPQDEARAGEERLVQARIAAAEAHAEAARLHAEAALAEMAATGERARALQAEVESLVAQYARMRSEQDTAVHLAQAERNEAQARCTQLQRELEEARAEARHHQHQIAALQQRLAEAAARPQPAPHPEPQHSPAAALPPAPLRRGLAKRAALVAYRPFRPILRPLAWRGRTFLTGMLADDIRSLRGDLGGIRASLGNTVGNTGSADVARLADLVRSMEAALYTLTLLGPASAASADAAETTARHTGRD